MQDAQAILDTDPAADCIQEIINSYPGFAMKSIALPMLLHLEQLVCYREYLRNTHIAKLELTFTPVQPLMFRS
jgi:hypothetical protein